MCPISHYYERVESKDKDITKINKPLDQDIDRVLLIAIKVRHVWYYANYSPLSFLGTMDPRYVYKYIYFTLLLVCLVFLQVGRPNILTLTSWLLFLKIPLPLLIILIITIISLYHLKDNHNIEYSIEETSEGAYSDSVYLVP